jgi:hypothetical protein
MWRAAWETPVAAAISTRSSKPDKSGFGLGEGNEASKY